MTDEVVKGCQRRNANQTGSLRKAVETLRARFSSVRVETLVADGDTALSIRFVGDVANLAERHMLVRSLAECLPPALSILGVRPEQEHGGQELAGKNDAT